MLTAFFASREQPAAGNRRRLLFCLLLIGMTACLLACQRRPDTDVEGFKAAAQRAVRLIRSEYPQRARNIERLSALAEAATAGERATPWWQGSVGRTESAWLRALK